MRKTVFEQLCECAGAERVRRDEPMKEHTTFRIGGPADYFVSPENAEQVRDIIAVCRKERIPWYVIGNGSNLLVGDKGYRGVIIQIYRNMNRIEVKGDRIYVQAGALLSKIGARALECALTGMEFAAGIPGTMGGAVVMNAGAYDGEIKDILSEATVLEPDGSIRVIPVDELAMGYRTSIVKEKEYIVLEAVLQLQSGNTEKIRERMEDLKKRRTDKQPLEFPSAGSAFKRREGYFAGKLIMDTGLKGYRVGDAMVSEKHCGFVINAGCATAKDVRTLMDDVRDKVKEQFGVELEPEIKFLGDF